MALIVCAALAAGALGVAFGATSSQPARTAIPGTPVAPPAGLDEATKKAAELQRAVDDIKSESTLLDERIKQTNARILQQAAAVAQAQQAVAAAQTAFDDRIVDMYKAGNTEPLLLLLGSSSVSEALDRGQFLLSIVEQDKSVLQQANQASSDAAYQQRTLDALKAQDVELRTVYDNRLRTLQRAASEQRALVAQLNAQQQAYLAYQARLDAALRQSWLGSGYSGANVTRDIATVDQYPGVTFVIDKGEPTAYTSTGIKSTELCSQYGNADNAPTPSSTASGRPFNENEFTCATVMKDPSDPNKLMPFGTRLAVSRGDRHIIVVVTDRGPYIPPRTVDLSKAAAAALAYSGVEYCQVEIVLPK